MRHERGDDDFLRQHQLQGKGSGNEFTENTWVSKNPPLEKVAVFGQLQTITNISSRLGCTKTNQIPFSEQNTFKTQKKKKKKQGIIGFSEFCNMNGELTFHSNSFLQNIYFCFAFLHFCIHINLPKLNLSLCIAQMHRRKKNVTIQPPKYAEHKTFAKLQVNVCVQRNKVHLE